MLGPTQVAATGAPAIPIDDKLYRDGGGAWKVYDVVIDGISLVTNYRSTFARQIQTGAAMEKDRAKRMSVGIDSLIEATLAPIGDTGFRIAPTRSGAAAGAASATRAAEAAARGLHFVPPERVFCTDNAAMIASVAAWRLAADGPSPLDTGADPSLDLPRIA